MVTKGLIRAPMHRELRRPNRSGMVVNALRVAKNRQTVGCVGQRSLDSRRSLHALRTAAMSRPNELVGMVVDRAAVAVRGR